MLFAPTQDKVLTFAAIAQAGKIVTQLAATPKHDESALRASARSLLETDPKNIEEVFGGAHSIDLGLQTIHDVFRGRSVSSLNAKELIRYMMAMDQLAERLNQSDTIGAVIEKGLIELGISFNSLLEAESDDQANQAEYDDFYAHLGTLYQKTLSQLPPKIIVRGAEGYLQSERSVARVRTALFAGVRAAFLWHQQGGRRWHLLFARSGYADIAKDLRNLK